MWYEEESSGAMAAGPQPLVPYYKRSLQFREVKNSTVSGLWEEENEEQ